jgi:hypothetical protein
LTASLAKPNYFAKSKKSEAYLFGSSIRNCLAFAEKSFLNQTFCNLKEPGKKIQKEQRDD